MASTLVDDSDYHVQYQPGWIWEQGVAEVRATRHGAAIPGLRAWLPFTGTGVRVVGTLGPSDTYGQPRTTYLLDGAVAGTYDAPRTGQVRYNVTFFEARNLVPGDHIITVNNTDGAPHTFWLDYILIDPEPEEGQVTTSTTTTTTSTNTMTTKGTGPTPDPDPDPAAREPSHSSSGSTVSSRPSSSSGPTSTTGSTASSGSRSLTVTPNASATSNGFPSGASNATLSVQLISSANGDSTVVSTVSVTLPVGAAAQTSATTTNSDVGGAGAGSGLDAAAQGESHSDAGAIAGAAVAGIAVVAIVAVVYLFLRRRRRPQKAPDTVPQFSYASDHRGATLPTEPHSHQVDAVSPSEMTHGSVESLSESYTPSPSSSSALLVPMRQASPPLPPVPPPPPPPVSEKSAQSSSSSSPDTPTSGFSTDSRTRSESTHSSEMVETGPALNSRASSASLSTLMPASAGAVLPPGAWHAPPDAHGRAQTLLRSLFSRGARAERGEDMVTVSRDVDSGLRLYDEVVLPPPYTQD